MALIRFEDILACFELTRIDEDRFGAPPIPMDYRRIYGGQLLAQSLIAAAATCDEAKSPRSIHVIFPREGDLDAPLSLEVARVQEGRSFATRTLVGRQGDRIILTAQVSLHAPEADDAGPSHQLAEPFSVLDPERASPVDLGMNPFDNRVVGGVDLESREAGEPRLALFMKTPDLGNAPALHHQALLAYSTDLTLIGTALRAAPGLSDADAPEKIATAVTAHQVVFHRAFRCDDWLLLEQASPVATGARAMGRGDVFDAAGQLVASYAQESLIRFARPK